MKKFPILLLAVMMLVMTGCRGETDYGECVGLIEDKSPNLEYEVSTRNLIVAIIFSETALVPLIYAVGYIWCPVGRVVIEQDL